MEIQIIKEVRELISKNKLPEALKLFATHLDKGNIKIANGLIQLQNKWNANENDRHIQSDDQYKLECRRVTERVLNYLQEIETPSTPFPPILKSELLAFAVPLILIGGLSYWYWHAPKKETTTIPVVSSPIVLPKLQPTTIQHKNLQTNITAPTNNVPSKVQTPSTTPVAQPIRPERTVQQTKKVITAIFFMSYDQKKIRNKRVSELIQRTLLMILSSSDYQNVLEITNNSDHTYIKSDGMIQQFKTENEIQKLYKELELTPAHTAMIGMSNLEYNEGNNIYSLTITCTRHSNIKSIACGLDLSDEDVTLTPNSLEKILLPKLNETKFLSKISQLFKDDEQEPQQLKVKISHLPQEFQNKMQLILRLNQNPLKESDFTRGINDISFNASWGKNHIEVCNVAGSICKCADFSAGQSENIYLQDCSK
jgi:hypothetical protein